MAEKILSWLIVMLVLVVVALFATALGGKK